LAGGIEEHPRRTPPCLLRAVAELVENAEKTPPRKLRGQSGHASTLRALFALYGIKRRGALFHPLAPALRADHHAFCAAVGGRDFGKRLVAGLAKEFALLHKTAVQCGSR